jgi:hypothetical protein
VTEPTDPEAPTPVFIVTKYSPYRAVP